MPGGVLVNNGGAGGGVNLLVISDDGTYIKFTYDGLDIFKIRKSSGNFMVKGGFDSDVSL